MPPAGWRRCREPDVGRVLAAIHLNPEHDWSVAALAKVMGASRSGFAKRFADIVGETPARYMLRVRMHQARLWLQRDRMRVSLASRSGSAMNRRPPSAAPSSGCSEPRRAITDGRSREGRDRLLLQKRQIRFA